MMRVWLELRRNLLNENHFLQHDFSFIVRHLKLGDQGKVLKLQF